MNHHYVLAPHDPALAERATALVEAHQPGHGIRAIATAQDPGDFHHVIALQAADHSALRALLLDLQVTEPVDLTAPGRTSPIVLTVCTDPPCDQLNRSFAYVPSRLPICDAITFIVMELDRDVHDIADDFTLPPIDSHLAGVAISDGRTLLVELANDDREQLDRDVAQLESMANIRSVRRVHTTGRELVRSPHT